MTKISYQPVDSGSLVLYDHEGAQVNPTQSHGYTVITKEALISEMDRDKSFHQKALSQAEYDMYLTAIKNKADKDGIDLYTYQLAAMARAVYENFKMFAPEIAIDPAIIDAVIGVVELDPVFTHKYNEEVQKYRDEINSTTSDDKPNIAAFNKLFNSTHYIHPMLRYGIVTKKG